MQVFIFYFRYVCVRITIFLKVYFNNIYGSDINVYDLSVYIYPHIYIYIYKRDDLVNITLLRTKLYNILLEAFTSMRVSEQDDFFVA